MLLPVTPLPAGVPELYPPLPTRLLASFACPSWPCAGYCARAGEMSQRTGRAASAMITLRFRCRFLCITCSQCELNAVHACRSMLCHYRHNSHISLYPPSVAQPTTKVRQVIWGKALGVRDARARWKGLGALCNCRKDESRSDNGYDAGDEPNHFAR